jgi:hypothetical protein
MINSIRNLHESCCAVGLQINGLLAIFLIACYVFIPGTAAAQALPTQTPSAAAKAAVPVTMTECEGTNNCATWTFLGGQGNGQWPSGEIANLSVDRSDKDSVVIRRADSTGASAGLTAIYTGTRHGDRVGGEYTSSWPGHWDKKSGNWYATVQSPEAPPPVMRVCANPSNWNQCSTWTWVNGHYDGWREWGAIATMTVESFTRDSVVIRRADTGPPGPGRPGAGFTMVYRGAISSQGNSILDGVSQGTSGAGGPFRAYWGEALRDLPPATNPAQNPRPTVIVPVMPAVCVPWFFTVICG